MTESSAMELSPLQLVGGGAGLATGGSAVTAFFNWLAGRSKTKAYTMGAVDHAVQTAMGIVTDRLEVVEAQHSICEQSLREVRQDLEATKRLHQAEIDRLMRGRVALLGEKPPED